MSRWAGPEAEMMRSVPPDTGVPADDELLVVGDDVDDELHAARAAAASTAAVSPAKRLGVLIIDMFPLGQECKRAQANPLVTRAADHYLPGETVRFRQRNPDQNRRRGLIVMEIVLVRHPTSVKVTLRDPSLTQPDRQVMPWRRKMSATSPRSSSSSSAFLAFRALAGAFAGAAAGTVAPGRVARAPALCHKA